MKKKEEEEEEKEEEEGDEEINGPSSSGGSRDKVLLSNSDRRLEKHTKLSLKPCTILNGDLYDTFHHNALSVRQFSNVVLVLIAFDRYF